MHRKSGFSLIELLVVIAIIAILAAILFPIFLAAKSKSLQTKCMANLKQMGVALSGYLSDTDGRYPTYAERDPLTGNWTGSWFTVLQKYSKTRLLAYCPADGQKPVSVQEAANYGLKQLPGAKRPSYAKNVYLDYWSGSGGYNQVPPPTESIVAFTRTTAFLMDGPPTIDSDGADTWWGPPTTYYGTTGLMGKLSYEAERRHAGGANVLFCDWHVGIVRPDEWKSTREGTGASNPLKNLPNTAHLTPDANNMWSFKNDGTHPWFRPD